MRSYSAVVDSIRSGNGSHPRGSGGTGRRRTFGYIHTPVAGHRPSGDATICGGSCGEVSGVEDDLAPTPLAAGFSPDRFRRWGLRNRDPVNVGSPSPARGGRKSESGIPPLFPASVESEVPRTRRRRPDICANKSPPCSRCPTIGWP
jgi:hypothetical protein